MRVIPVVGTFNFVLVSDEDFDYLAKYKWHLNSYGYVRTSISRKTVFMHRLIFTRRNISINKPKQVDHINLDKLDNRFENLRLVIPQHNLVNRTGLKNTTSRFKGVSLTKYGTYKSSINENGRSVSLGFYRTEEEAALVYNAKATELFGEYAYLNQIDSPISPKRNIVSSTGYIGVYPTKSSKWKVAIRVDNKIKTIGYFDDIEKAARTYDKYAYKLKGEKAKLNFKISREI